MSGEPDPITFAEGSPAASAPRLLSSCSGSGMRVCLLSVGGDWRGSHGFDVLSGDPHEAGELAGDGHDDLVAVHAACAKSAIARAQT